LLKTFCQIKDFTNSIEKMDVKSLAENDEQEVVREVHEFFADFVSIGQHVFSMNLPNCSEVFKANFFKVTY
jgi:vacuolar protein sorting-associated protein 45